MAVAVESGIRISEMSGANRLALRVSEMIGSPIAQIRRAVTIHRLDTDSDEAWGEVVGILREMDGLRVTHNDDSTVRLDWRMPDEVVQAIADRERAEACEEA